MSTDLRPQAGRRDPHDVLGVPSGADRQQVMRAFHRRVRHGGHPDTGGDAATFDEIIRARDTLLDRAAHHIGGDPDPTVGHAGAPPKAGPRPPQPPPRRTSPTHAAPTSPTHHHPASPTHPPARTSKLAIATAVLALLGPFFWPVAIAVGLVARRRIKRTGLGGETLVAVVVFVLCVLTLPVLVRILSVVLIP